MQARRLDVGARRRHWPVGDAGRLGKIISANDDNRLLRSAPRAGAIASASDRPGEGTLGVAARTRLGRAEYSAAPMLRVSVTRIIDPKRGEAMTANRSIPATGHQPSELGLGSDVVSVRDERTRLAGMLRAADGFRVDGPDGRVGVLGAVIPDYGDGLPDHIRITTGLFLIASVDVAFGQVVSVDPFARRVGISVVPECRRAARRQIAGRVRRFRRAAGQ
jgi:hypothetical protein